MKYPNQCPGLLLLCTDGMDIWEFPWVVDFTMGSSNMEIQVHAVLYRQEKAPAWQAWQLGASNRGEGAVMVAMLGIVLVDEMQ